MIIYRITNTITEKCYIGQTVRPLEERWKQHCLEARYPKNKFHKSIKKHGTECWIVEVLETIDNSLENLNEREVFWISFYDTFKNGYNSTTGGSKGLHSSETKERISSSMKGENNPMFGTKRTEAERENLSRVNKGRKTFEGREHTDDTKEKISKKMSGKTKSEEHKRKMSQSRKRIMTDELRQRISETLKRRKQEERLNPLPA